LSRLHEEPVAGDVVMICVRDRPANAVVVHVRDVDVPLLVTWTSLGMNRWALGRAAVADRSARRLTVTGTVW